MICTRCALCCDGTLFGQVRLTPPDEARVRKLPIVAATVADERMLQPCAALELGRCSIYAERPASCARYRCRLLDRVEAGELDEAAALATVERARALVRAIAALLTPEQEQRGVWRGGDERLAELERDRSPSARAELGELVRLRLLLSFMVVQELDADAAKLQAMP